MTDSGDIAKSIGVALAQRIKGKGFRKRANSFNRLANDAIVHHVSVQLGSYDPTGMHAIPGLLPNLYGKYRVNFGVYVPGMDRMGAPRSSWINDYDCQLHWGLGNLMPGGSDRWWDLRDRLAVEEVGDLVMALGVPKLDSFPDIESVLRAYELDGEAAFGPVTSEAAALDVADLLLSRGERGRAQMLLKSYVEKMRTSNHVGHKTYLREYLVEREFHDLAASDF